MTCLHMRCMPSAKASLQQQPLQSSCHTKLHTLRHALTSSLTTVTCMPPPCIVARNRTHCSRLFKTSRGVQRQHKFNSRGRCRPPVLSPKANPCGLSHKQPPSQHPRSDTSPARACAGGGNGGKGGGGSYRSVKFEEDADASPPPKGCLILGLAVSVIHCDSIFASEASPA